MTALPPGFEIEAPAMPGLPPGFVLDAGPDDLPLPPVPPVPIGRVGGFVQGVGDMIHGGAQLLTQALPAGAVDAVNNAAAWANRQPVIGPATRALGMVPATPEQVHQQTVQRADDYAAGRAAAGLGPDSFDVPRMAGQFAGALPLALALPAGGSLAGSVVAGAVTGGAMGALQPVEQPGADYWDAKKAQAETGAAMGATTGPLGLLAGRMLAPRIAPEVRALHQAGVNLTPGQIIGGLPRRIEDAATSLPGVGDAIRGAQRRGVESFNRAAGNQVLAPLGETLPDAVTPGRPMAQHLHDRISDAYTRAVGGVTPFRADGQFGQDVAQVAQQFLTPSSQREFAREMQDRVVSRLSAGPLDGATYQTIKSELGGLAAQARASGEQAGRELAGAYEGVQRAFQGLLERSNPQAREALRAADAAFAARLRVDGGAAAAGATEGVFTPAQLAGAVRREDHSLRHGAYARGDALLQGLTDAGRAVLPPTIGDSGTFTRAMLAGGTLASGALTPGVAAGAAAAGAAYTPAMQQALARMLLAQRPYAVRRVGDALAMSGPAASAPLAALLLSGAGAPSVAPLGP